MKHSDLTPSDLVPSDLVPSDLGPNLITRHFSPAWFAAVMGTAVVPLAISFTGADWTDWAARIMMPLASLMFILALVPWLLVFFNTLKGVISRKLFVPSH
jgi:tellurite resistance protein TehA-like permease